MEYRGEKKNRQEPYNPSIPFLGFHAPITTSKPRFSREFQHSSNSSQGSNGSNTLGLGCHILGKSVQSSPWLARMDDYVHELWPWHGMAHGLDDRIDRIYSVSYTVTQDGALYLIDKWYNEISKPILK